LFFSDKFRLNTSDDICLKATTLSRTSVTKMRQKENANTTCQ